MQNSRYRDMARKKIEVNEEVLKEIMTGDLPVFGKEQPVRETVRERREADSSESREKENEAVNNLKADAAQAANEGSGNKVRYTEREYRERFLAAGNITQRSQTYVSRENYERIRRFLPVIAPDASISGYVNNVLTRHLEECRELVNELYNREISKPL